MINAHRRYNYIGGLEIDGTLTNDMEVITNEMQNFYETLNKEGADLRTQWLYEDARCISREEDELLQQPF